MSTYNKKKSEYLADITTAPVRQNKSYTEDCGDGLKLEIKRVAAGTYAVSIYTPPNLDLKEDSINVHGGFSSFKRGEIGWNYYHDGDFMPFVIDNPNSMVWTFEQVKKEAENVVLQLKKIANNKN